MPRTLSHDQRDALDQLRRELKPGTTVHTILRHVSRSGMSRSISAVVISKRGEVHTLDYLIARAGLGKVDQRNGGIRIGGAGMDMGFALVYGLSRALYPDGHRCTGDARTCPSNDHANDYSSHAHAWGERFPLVVELARAAEWPQDDEDRATCRAIRNHIIGARNDAFRAALDELISRKRRHSDGGYALGQRWL